MTKNSKDPSLTEKYQLTVNQDLPDIRDWPYEPTLLSLASSMPPPDKLLILNQESEGACTGFGLAATINLLNQKRGNNLQVSPRMLYEMAKRHDEWPGVEYSGSSCRGAIKGWYNMGVCRENTWKYEQHNPDQLTLKRAKEARENTIGAYYRVQPRISDFHAALNETHVLYCSAQTHEGWSSPNRKTGLIPFDSSYDDQGGHAFAIVGYNDKGFWVQNSWSTTWGKKGLGLWLYEDWYHNLMDAWVVSLALPTPQIWHLPDKRMSNISSGLKTSGPQRSEIAGHFVHFDDGRFHTQGKYWSDLNDVSIAAKNLSSSTKYKHLLLYAHGGLNSPLSSAKRIAAMKTTFKKNGIYPYHFMYDTGLIEELKDVIIRRDDKISDRVTGFSDFTDKLIELSTRVPGRALWREMKRGARKPFENGGDGSLSIKTFLDELTKDSIPKLNIHIVGHSTGGILLAWLLNSLDKLDMKIRVSSCSLLAPACSIKLFRDIYQPLLLTPKDQLGIDRLHIFNLTDELERDDQVAKLYRKSLLYLVSKSFEEDIPEAILGMERYSSNLKKSSTIRKIGKRFTIHYSDGQHTSITASSTHGGFDNDPATMNTVMKIISEQEPEHPFTNEDLNY